MELENNAHDTRSLWPSSPIERQANRWPEFVFDPVREEDKSPTGNSSRIEQLSKRERAKLFSINTICIVCQKVAVSSALFRLTLALWPNCETMRQELAQATRELVCEHNIPVCENGVQVAGPRGRTDGRAQTSRWETSERPSDWNQFNPIQFTANQFNYAGQLETVPAASVRSIHKLELSQFAAAARCPRELTAAIEWGEQAKRLGPNQLIGSLCENFASERAAAFSLARHLAV